MKWKAALLLALILIVARPPVHAAPWTDTFNNPVATDEVYLFMVDGGVDNVTFQGWDQAPYTNGFFGWGAHSWTTDIEQANLLAASGNDFGTAWWWNQGNFAVNYSNDQNDFSIEYAYLLDGAIVQAGSRMWDAAQSIWVSSPDFNATIPNPIGGTAWLLASGLLAVVGIRRKKPPST